MAGRERMTARACQVMAIAEQEARRRGAAAVGPEHVLLGLALEGAGLAAGVLRNLGASAERLTKALPVAVSETGSPEPLPWASTTEQVLSQATAELVLLHHNYIGTEHLLLAVVRAESGAVPDLLSCLGVAPECVRQEVYDVLGHGL